MSLKLPPVVNKYFAGDKVSVAILAEYFTHDAILIDEGNTFKGTTAIEKWKDSSSLKYQYANEPFTMQAQADKLIVISHVEGNFPNSPVGLRYTFELQGDKISSLEITL